MASGIRVEQLSAAVGMRAGGGDSVALLAAAVEVADDIRGVADELLDRYVASARADGRSWSEIGVALGVSKQAAQQRFVAAPVDSTAWAKGFDEDARAVVHAAQLHARNFHHRYLATEHLLLALTADSGLAGATLGHLGVGADQVTAHIHEVVGDGHSSETATLGISPRAKRVLEAAGQEARRLGHRCGTAAPEHVLLALSGQRDTLAAQLLRDLGVSDERLRSQLGELLAGEAPELADKIRQPQRGRIRRSSRRRQAA
jgi:hypothetical protein